MGRGGRMELKLKEKLNGKANVEERTREMELTIESGI